MIRYSAMKELKDLKLKSKADLAKLESEKLTQELKTSEKLLFTLKMKLANGEQKQTHLISAVRKYVARVRTFLVNAK